MSIHFNKPAVKKRRRNLRKTMTQPEIILWSRLKNRQLLGLKFRRQFSVNAYILDFYCPEIKLAVEVDGESHFTSLGQSLDRKRTRELDQLGIAVVRISNNEIIQGVDSVIATLALLASDRSEEHLHGDPNFQGDQRRAADP
ncbi:MAG: DUF559 domain-containing protein [Planctomycetes bacterium]|nr:DUF559 domain-containing protein [Planctomycetota bacterium]